MTEPLCPHEQHDPMNGNMWHRWIDDKGRRWASRCPEWESRQVADKERKTIKIADEAKWRR